MISLEKFLSCVQQNINRVNDYELGMDGTGGQCDCIGLIIGAFRLAGEKWTWTHGSNYSARNRTRNLRQVKKAGEIKLGELVYKAKEPGDSGYDLPDKYKSGSDLRDYYHVGVVTSVNPFIIMHCTSVQGGIKKDTTLGKWNYAGEFDKVDYNESADSNTNLEGNYMPTELPVLFQAEVMDSLNLRSGPSKSYKVVEKLPRNGIVDVLERFDEVWWKVHYNGEVGYAMNGEGDKTFLKAIGMDEEPTGKWAEVRKKAEELIALINQAFAQ